MSRQVKNTKKTNIVDEKKVIIDKNDVDVTYEKNIVAKVIENCLDDLYAQGITGLKALHNLAYLIILKFIEPHIGTEIDIDNYNFPNLGDLSPEQFKSRRKRLMDLVRFSNLAKESEQNLFSVTEALWDEVLSEHPITSKIFQKGRWFDIAKPDPNKNKDQLRGIKLLKKLIDQINSIPHTEVDVLGHAYEHVANDNGGQTLGQFFTQSLIKDIMVDLINPQILPNGQIESCCDPTMGSAGFLSTYVKYLSNQAITKKIKIDWTKNKEKIYGKEIESDTYHLAIANMLLSTGHIFEHLEHGDSINMPITEKFDIVLANPPFGIKIFKYDTITCADKEKYFPIAVDNAICLFLQTIIDMLKINGRAAVVLPRGKELFGDSFINIRKFLMKTCEVKEIINLPSDAFTNTTVKTCIIFFIKKKEGIEIVSKNNIAKTRSRRVTYEYKFIEDYVTKSVKFYEYDKEEKGNKRLITDLPFEELLKKGLSLEISRYIKQEKENYGTGIVMKKLGDICDIRYGTRIIKKMSNSLDLYPVYGGGDETFRTNTFNRDGFNIIISRFGVSEKCVRLIDKQIFLNDSGLTIHPKYDNLSIKYLGYYLYNSQDKIFALARGSAQKNIDIHEFKNIEIPVPPIGWQNKIVDYLDFLELSNQYFMKEIEMRHQLIIKYVKSYTEIPHLKSKKLGDVCKVIPGQYITKEMKIDGEYPVYGGGNISYYINQYNREDEIIIAKDGVSFECIRYEKGKFFLNHHGWTLNCNLTINKTCLYYILLTTQDKIYNLAIGAAQKGINQENFYDTEIPIPSEEDQKLIVEYCENQDKKIAELKQEIEQNKLIAKDYLTKVLKECERNDEDPEPEPEPNSVELKSIELKQDQNEMTKKRAVRVRKVTPDVQPGPVPGGSSEVLQKTRTRRTKKIEPVKIVINSESEDEDPKKKDD